MKRFTNWVVVLSMTLFITGCQDTKQEEGRFYTNAGDLSFKIPDGWELESSSESPNPLLFGPSEDDFAPNLNVLSRPSTLSVSTFAETSTRQLRAAFPGIRGFWQDDFTADSGERAATLSYFRDTPEQEMWQIQYYFKRRGTIYVITGTAPGKDRKAFASLMAQTMKTFRFE